MTRFDFRRRVFARAVAISTLGACSRGVWAQAPDRAAMTILVGAASSMDFTARLLAETLREPLDRPVVALSKLGAGGRLALAELKRSAPDGRTLMLSTSSVFTIFPNIYTKLEYDPVADFTPIINVAWFDVGIAVSPTSGINSLAELVRWVRAQGREVVYGAAPGTGSASHFAGIALAQAAGLSLNPIPYKDSAQAISDTIGGQIPIIITGTSPLVAQHRTGRLRLLATSGPERSPLVPDVPTMKEGGVNAEIVIHASLYGPARLPGEQVQSLQRATEQILARAEVREKLAQQGMAVMPMDPSRLARELDAHRRNYAELVRVSGYKPEAN